MVRRGPFGRYCQLEGEEQGGEGEGEGKKKKKKKKKGKDVNVGFPEGVRLGGRRGREGGWRVECEEVKKSQNPKKF